LNAQIEHLQFGYQFRQQSFFIQGIFVTQTRATVKQGNALSEDSSIPNPFIWIN